jgi:hypothetical protein
MNSSDAPPGERESAAARRLFAQLITARPSPLARLRLCVHLRPPFDLLLHRGSGLLFCRDPRRTHTAGAAYRPSHWAGDDVFRRSTVPRSSGQIARTSSGSECLILSTWPRSMCRARIRNTAAVASRTFTGRVFPDCCSIRAKNSSSVRDLSIAPGEDHWS